MEPAPPTPPPHPQLGETNAHTQSHIYPKITSGLNCKCDTIVYYTSSSI